jgi:cyclic pyranopterin phosphate synthase
MDFTHLDNYGSVRMVDISEKEMTERIAVARGYVYCSAEVLDKINSNSIGKGNVITTAKLAGIQAAKKTSELIPLCHSLHLSFVGVEVLIIPEDLKIEIRSEVKTKNGTGVEMEALTAVTLTALTIYDMCKSIDKEMKISNIELLEKKGGKSGNFKKL